jgi:hypothetical protein
MSIGEKAVSYLKLTNYAPFNGIDCSPPFRYKPTVISLIVMLHPKSFTYPVSGKRAARIFC